MRRSNARTPAVDFQPKMDSLKLHYRPNAGRSNFASRIFSYNSKHTKGNIWIFCAIAAIFVGLCYLFVVSRGSQKYLESKIKFGIVIDGGSTGTRIHVFDSVLNEEGVPVVDFGKKELASMRVSPGLSSFEKDPEKAGASLLELLDFGKRKVPKDYWGETEVRLMATAGLRRLEVDVQKQILESCRKVLRSSGFKFRNNWASVITGSDEGLYAWVAANYALGTLGDDPQQTTGIIELGGASAQVTFVSSEPLPLEFSHTLKFGRFSYNLYSHSMLNFGQNVAFDSLRQLLLSKDLKLSSGDPCIPKGYLNTKSQNLSPSTSHEKNKYLSNLHAMGNFSECRSAASMLLQKGKEGCPYQRCHIGSTFVPKLQGKFLATENFFYTTEFFGLAPKASLSDLMLAGEQFCGEHWSKLKQKYHTIDEENLIHYCFSSAYIVALLHDGLGVSLDDDRIGFANQVGDIPLDWALGAFILHNTAESSVEHPDWIATFVTNDASKLLSFFLVFAVLIFTAWSISKWRKPQMKTIYDLEKGRYIVTHVNR